jgi:hypothetical protein
VQFVIFIFHYFFEEFIATGLTEQLAASLLKSTGLFQWRNVISGGPRFKIFEGPLVEVLKARVEHRICTSFLGCPGHVHPENF